LSKMLRFHLFECYFWHAVIWRYWGGRRGESGEKIGHPKSITKPG